MVAVIAATLLRALRRFAVPEHALDDAQSGVVGRGVLLGSRNPSSGDVALWGVVRDASQWDVVRDVLPGGVDALGAALIWRRGVKPADDDLEAERRAAQELASSVDPQAVAGVDDAALVLVYALESQRVHLFSRDTQTEELVVAEARHSSDALAATGHVLLRTALDVEAPLAHLAGKMKAWTEQLASIEQHPTRVCFRFPEQPQSLFDCRGVDVLSPAAASPSPLSALIRIAERRELSAAKKKKKSKKQSAQAALDDWDVASSSRAKTATESDPLDAFALQATNASYLQTTEYSDIADIELLHSMAPFPQESQGTARAAPQLLVPSDAKAPFLRRQVHVDAVVVVPQTATAVDAVHALRRELQRQVSRLTRQLASLSPSATTASLSCHHFALIGAAFPVTLVALDEQVTTEETLGLTRLELAELLLQPTNQPLFDVSRCSLVLEARRLDASDVLRNVHEGIAPSGVPNGTQYLVDGFYGYYHYMQQGMNDKGWGCAYRSLQTLASWLVLQHYADDAAVPSHREIQEVLIKIGDKPPSFLNSRDWIGSMEVGYVLDERFGVSFRSLNVASGPQLVEHAQELKHHFQTQGTPVMMGGGSLAFTLLGIDYNESTGDCAFLILDPHYAGAEDLEAIQTKPMALEGYKAVPCGWRRASTLAKSFYNLCLPQRPTTASP
ncbi:hypothetical protein P43SY_005975 [Pythium insidiosum]|uniref:UFSP1/2/DUB catalytic domain-containing protein n=1 Tax=Pythium insidiosum TaxID=114742 RepID=A0AAD5L890_PYTIN|nr:hypothetical protein P43SY_005975 [Pythium insidiosum]